MARVYDKDAERDVDLKSTVASYNAFVPLAATGTTVLTAGTATVSNPLITANSQIVVFVQTPGGTVGAPFVATITAGTSFVIKSTSSTDTSTVRYNILSY